MASRSPKRELLGCGFLYLGMKSTKICKCDSRFADHGCPASIFQIRPGKLSANGDSLISSVLASRNVSAGYFTMLYRISRFCCTRLTSFVGAQLGRDNPSHRKQRLVVALRSGEYQDRRWLPHRFLHELNGEPPLDLLHSNPGGTFEARSASSSA